MASFKVDNHGELLQHVFDCFPNESAGVLADGRFIPCNNIHSSPQDNFKIDPAEWLCLSLEHGIQAVIHSHTRPSEAPISPLGVSLDLRAPSMADMVAMAATGLPWGILHCDGTTVSELLWIDYKCPGPLLNRPFIANVNDCHTLYRDYMKLNHSIEIPLYPRPPVWQHAIPDIFELNLGAEHTPINISDIREGDLLLFRMGGKHINHCGVALSSTQFLHQNYNKMSGEDYIQRYSKFLVRAVRHNRLVNDS